MEFKEGIYKSAPRGTLFEPEPDPKPKPRQLVRWLLALGVLLLLAVLAGGVFAYTHLPRNAPTIGATPHTNWCVSTGATLDAQAGSPSLRHVLTLSPENVWVVGNITKIASTDRTNNTELGVPLVEHWDGTHWRTVATADTTPLFSSLLGKFTGAVSKVAALNSLAAISPDDMWAVGEISVAQSPNSGGLGKTLIEHWDGHQWHIVASPSPQELNGLTSVVAISANIDPNENN
jgi:hypothetical protein